jgi:aspartate aminotransferase
MEPYFRLSTATSLAVLEDGCDRIEKACRALR